MNQGSTGGLETVGLGVPYKSTVSSFFCNYTPVN